MALLTVDVQLNLPVVFIETTGLVAFVNNFELLAINNNRVLVLLAPNKKNISSVDVEEGIKYSWPDNKIICSSCVVPFIIVLFDKVVIPDTFNDDTYVENPFNFVVTDTFKLLAFNIDALDKLFRLLK